MLNIHNITGLNWLNAGLTLDISHLITICNKYDNITYDIFMENGENCNDIKCFYFYTENNIIVSFLSLFMPYENCLNVYGCTLPPYRNKGIFTLLLSALTDELKNYNISSKMLSFPIKSELPAFKNAIQYLNNRHYSIKDTECMLRYDLQGDKDLFSESFFKWNINNLELEYEETENENEYSLWLENNYIGGCLVYYNDNNTDSYSTATIYDYEIADEYQGLGYGKAGLKLILDSLRYNDISYIILHTSKSNKKAFNLYTGCGFNIIESIDYYCKD